MMRRMKKALDIFQSRVAQKLTGRQPQRRKVRKEGTWYYPFVGGSNEGGRDRPDTDFNPPEEEYGSAIYRDAADFGPVRKGHQAAGRAGSPEVVGTVRD